MQDFFPEWGQTKRTAVYASADGGATWRHLSMLPGQFWSSLFLHRGKVWALLPCSRVLLIHYLMEFLTITAGQLFLVGTSDSGGSNAVAVARSTDGGATWTPPVAVMQAPQGNCSFGTGK